MSLPYNIRTLDELFEHLRRSDPSLPKEASDERYKLLNLSKSANDGLSSAYFMTNIEGFDADYFRITPAEAKVMDPRHRILLENVQEALWAAGITREEIEGSRTGVFIGISSSDEHGRMVERHLESEFSDSSFDSDGINYFNLGNTNSVGVGRISYYFDLKGANMAIDASCCSAAVAIDRGYKALVSGECDLVIVGGVNLILSQVTDRSFRSVKRMLSPDGVCKAYDSSANGYVRSEGCGILVLRRLADAIEHHDDVLGVILGSAINHDGRTVTLTAPNPDGQFDVTREAMDSASVTANQISYTMGHGTGTVQGDAIETMAQKRVHSSHSRPVVLNSVKSIIGHLEAAAGVANPLAVLASLKHSRIFSLPMLTTVNPELDPKTTNLLLPGASIPYKRQWKNYDEIQSPLRRITGTTSLGFSGTSAHLVLSEPPTLTRFVICPTLVFFIYHVMLLQD